MANCNENVIFNSKCTRFNYLVAWLHPDLLTGELTALLGPPSWDGKGEGLGFKWRGLEEKREWGKGEKGRKGLGLTV